MVRYKEQPSQRRLYYEKMLKLIGSLSRLFSESDAPFYDSRIAENLYCRSFGAKNVGRDDSSVDAIMGTLGIGIKTFSGKSAQKIAEFNKALLEFSSLTGKEKARKIAELRNKRIEFTKNEYGLDELIYHCIRREKGKIIITESSMDLIDLPHIKIIEDTKKTIKFTDGLNEYVFNISKSVLLKKFPKEEILVEIPVALLKDPFKLLENIASSVKAIPTQQYPRIILPLYAKIQDKFVVPEKSGLNQWNAGGRDRHKDEVYIRIPSWIHEKFPSFFPDRDTNFKLSLPDGQTISAKICQEGGKALMSNPNKVLGNWILRKVLKLRQGKLLKYKDLQEIGIDSVIVEKMDSENYSIDFREEGEFEEFEEENKD